MLPRSVFVAEVQTLTTATHATPKQNLKLERAYEISNVDSEKIGHVVLREFQSTQFRLI